MCVRVCVCWGCCSQDTGDQPGHTRKCLGLLQTCLAPQCPLVDTWLPARGPRGAPEGHIFNQGLWDTRAQAPLGTGGGKGEHVFLGL